MYTAKVLIVISDEMEKVEERDDEAKIARVKIKGNIGGELLSLMARLLGRDLVYFQWWLTAKRNPLL